MILTGKKYDEFLKQIWGKKWKLIGVQRLRISRQTLHNRCKSETGLSRRIKRELLAITREQMALLGNIEQQLAEDLEI